MKYASVCSGIEAPSAAWEPLGWEPQWFSEIEPFPSAVLAHHHPNVTNHGDMTKFQEWEIGPGTVDVFVAGTPCQSFSVAGLRTGLDDPRGNLALVCLGIVEKLEPRWFVWENVPGVLSSNGGRDFGSFIGALAECGYGFSWRVLDAKYFGVPQKRRRVYLVASARGWQHATAVLFESENVRRNIATTNQQKPDSEVPAGDKLVQAPRWWNGDVNSQTIDAVFYKKQALPEKGRFPAVAVAPWTNCDLCDDFICSIHGCHVADCDCPSLETWLDHDLFPHENAALRYVTPLECERLQGFPDGYTAIPYRNKPADQCPDTPRYKALGNSMAVPVLRWIGERIEMVEKI